MTSHSPRRCKLCGKLHCLAGCVPLKKCLGLKVNDEKLIPCPKDDRSLAGRADIILGNNAEDQGDGRTMEVMEARVRLETILAQYDKGLMTEKEKNDAVFVLLYEVLYDGKED